MKIDWTTNQMDEIEKKTIAYYRENRLVIWRFKTESCSKIKALYEHQELKEQERRVKENQFKYTYAHSF